MPSMRAIAALLDPSMLSCTTRSNLDGGLRSR
jgi:hypothetical protein